MTESEVKLKDLLRVKEESEKGGLKLKIKKKKKKNFICLKSHGLKHTRPPCPSPIPGAYSNSCP